MDFKKFFFVLPVNIALKLFFRTTMVTANISPVIYPIAGEKM